MNFFQLSMRTISALLSIYLLLITVRVLLSWFQGHSLNRVKEILGQIVDPYLNLFRGISWLRIGMVDLSPILGFALISLVLQITSTLAAQGYVTVWGVIIYLISYIWNVIRFFADILVILMIVRLVSVLFMSNRSHPFFSRIDGFLYNINSKILGLFTRRSVSYAAALGISAAFIFICRWLIQIGLAYLFRFLQSI